MYKKSILLIFIVFGFSVFAQNAIDLKIKFSKYEKTDTIIFNSYTIDLVFENNTDTPYYFDRIVYRLFYFPIPITVNYGSYKGDVDAKIAHAQSFGYKHNKKGSEKDTIDILLIDDKWDNGNIKDSIVRMYLDYYSGVYNSIPFALSCNPYSVPPVAVTTEDFIKEYYYDTLLGNFILKQGEDFYKINDEFIIDCLLLPPKSKRTFTYDVGFLFLRKATYSLQIDLKENYLSDTIPDYFIIRGLNYLTPKKRSDKFRELTGYKRYNGALKSNKIFIISD